MKYFLDSDKPIHSCREASCKNCDVASKINCHFNGGQLSRFLIVAFSVAVIGGYGAFRFSPWALLIQLALYIIYFGFIEIRVMCSHCPHYGEPELKTLKCWANYGVPTIWKYRPGPMSLLEKIVFLVGMAAVALYPAVIIFLSQQIIIGLVYSIALLLSFGLLLTRLCTKCFNFACPFNRVDRKVKMQFLQHNPSINKAWSKADK